MVELIQDELKSLEGKHKIKILYAVESGSRAWGFASTNSDWDVRFIYVHTLDWYLEINEHKDNIEQILPNDIDLAGWELQKALRLFRKSNPPLMEWLNSPIIYKEVGPLAAELRTASKDYFNPKSCLYHYFHMARGNWEAYFKDEEVRLKKYLYVLRPILACKWIERTGQMPPVLFSELIKAEINEETLFQSIDELLLRKRQGEELETGPRIQAIDTFLKAQIEHFESYLSDYQFINQPKWEHLNKIFRNILKNEC